MTTNIEAIIAEIREDVSRKRTAGLFPPGLEDQLEQQYKAVLSQGQRGITTRNESIVQLLTEIRNGIDSVTGFTAVSSKVPGVSIVHRIVRRLIARQSTGLAAQIREVEQRTLELLELLAEQGRMFEDADVSMAANLSKHVLDRIAIVDHLAILVTDLEGRIRHLERAPE